MAHAEISFSRIEGKSRGYWLLVGVFGALTAIGLGAYMIAYLQGLQVYGTSNMIPWGQAIILLVYFIGLSAGSLILSGLTYVLGREEFRPISRVAVYAAILLILGAMLVIIVCKGRPEKVWRLFMLGFLNNMTSMFAVNSLLYPIYMIIGIFYLGLLLARSQFARFVGPFALAWAMLVHGGTGAIFGLISTKHAWYTPLRPFEFIAAAMTSGLALLIIVLVLTLRLTGRRIDADLIRSMGRLLIMCIIGLCLIVFVDKLTHGYAIDPSPVLFLLAGPFAWIFWGVQVLLAYVVPLVLLFLPATGRTVSGIVVASASAVVGIFGERVFLLIPGMALPSHYWPTGHVEGIYGAVGQYPVMPVETLISVGIFALLGLLYLLGLKFLDLLPNTEH